MEKYKLKDDLKVFGIPVETFPEGIGEAFDALVKLIPDGFNRPYYGISYVTDAGIVYHATALEKFEGEAEMYNCQRHTLVQGDYHTVTIRNWRQKLPMIKEVFTEMTKSICPDKERPCVEWYKTDDEMVCMVREK